MGTRCITVVTSAWPDQAETHHATIYRHWDGYLDGHGAWLADFLRDAVVTNGKVDESKHFNGPGRLASAIVAELVADDHDPDLMEKGTECGQEYEYHIDCAFGLGGGELTVTVYDGPMTFFGAGGDQCTNQVFTGTVPEYIAFIDGETVIEETG